MPAPMIAPTPSAVRSIAAERALEPVLAVLGGVQQLLDRLGGEERIGHPCLLLLVPASSMQSGPSGNRSEGVGGLYEKAPRWQRARPRGGAAQHPLAQRKFRKAVMIRAFVKSMKKAPTIGTTRNARGAGP